MIGRALDLEVCGVLPIESLDEDSETTPSLQMAGFAAKNDAARAPRNNRSVERPSLGVRHAYIVPVQRAAAHAYVLFGARQLSAASGVLARPSVQWA